MGLLNNSLHVVDMGARLVLCNEVVYKQHETQLIFLADMSK